MVELDESYFEFCGTSRQKEILAAFLKEGGVRKAASQLSCDHAHISRTLKNIRATAILSGYSPKDDMTHRVPEGFAVKGVSTLYGKDGQVSAQWVKSRENREQTLELMKEMALALCEDVPRVKPISPPKSFYENILVVIPWGDPHFGMASWHVETGDDFDLKIAQRDLCAAVDYLLEQGPASKRCVFINLGDFFHSSNLEGTTVRSGNILDMDSRMPKIIRVGLAAIRYALEKALARHEMVEIINAIGNHDDVLSMALSIMLANIYENEPRIVIHDAPTPRHYIKHGKVLIGVTHGHRTKDIDLPGIMATEKPEWWGQTKHRYFYRGHHHRDEKQEANGCLIEQFRTLSARDAWANAGGYLAGRDMKLIVHHKDFGEVQRITCSIDLLDSINKINEA